MTVSTLRSPYNVANWAVCLVNDEMTRTNREPVKRAYVAAGQVAWDDCCGMLVVAPERVYRSLQFPNEFAEREICDNGWLNVDLIILLVRCVPTVDNMGRAPSAQSLDDAYENILEDAAVVWNAFQCVEMPDDWEKANLNQTFVGAEGGCIGVETRVTIGVPQTRWGIR